MDVMSYVQLQVILSIYDACNPWFQFFEDQAQC
jgi:hypothetical protein